jgi:hypothetical protein
LRILALLQLWSSDYSRKARESPGGLKWQIAAFVDYYNPADRGDIIMPERKEIKRETIRKRRLLREAAA